jgi:hypothetical protein
MPKQTYSDDVRAQALAMLLAGASLSATAAHFGVSKNTISYWRNSQDATVVQNAIERSVRLDVGRLVAEYLAANLDALTAQARAVADPGWIAAQDAHALVAIHNALGDRAIQILGAIQPGGDDGGEAESSLDSAGPPGAPVRD